MKGANPRILHLPIEDILELNRQFLLFNYESFL